MTHQIIQKWWVTPQETSMTYRAFDLFFSIIGLAVLFPIFLSIALVLKLNGEKIFYLQKRVGRNKKKFMIIKFTTMLPESSKMKMGNITVRNDPRVTKFGKILRITKINELPQLINVLLGEMSIVGPRPLPTKSFNKYSEEGKLIVSKSKPGITGISSIIFRDEESFASKWQKNNISVEDMYREKLYPYKEKLEKWYIENQSLKVYFLLIFLTSLTLFISPKTLLSFFFKDLPKSEIFYNP